MRLVTVLHVSGDKHIIDSADICDAPNRHIPLRNRRGQDLGQSVTMKRLVAAYYGEIHPEAHPQPGTRHYP